MLLMIPLDSVGLRVSVPLLFGYSWAPKTLRLGIVPTGTHRDLHSNYMVQGLGGVLSILHLMTTNRYTYDMT